jgi:hypothetical protein
MPRGWLRLRTGTPPQLEPYRDDPRGLYEFVKAVVEAADAELLDFYFAAGRPVAYALVKDLDDFISIKAVVRILGAEDFKKLITVDHAVEALGREQTIRQRLAPE